MHEKSEEVPTLYLWLMAHRPKWLLYRILMLRAAVGASDEKVKQIAAEVLDAEPSEEAVWKLNRPRLRIEQFGQKERGDLAECFRFLRLVTDLVPATLTVEDILTDSCGVCAAELSEQNEYIYELVEGSDDLELSLQLCPGCLALPLPQLIELLNTQGREGTRGRPWQLLKIADALKWSQRIDGVQCAADLPRDPDETDENDPADAA